MVGFGTYPIPDDEVPGIVQTALEVGYRHVDTAEVYRNEAGVGTGIRAGMDELGLSREDVFVTTKAFPMNGEDARGGAEIIQACEGSLERLGLNHVDLCLIHAPFAGPGRVEQWRALVELKDRGMAAHIGVSNFSEAHIRELLDAGLPKPEADQIELHPWSQRPELVSYLSQNGIAPIAYSSLAPMSTWRTAPGDWSSKTDAMRADGAQADSAFTAMAEKYGVTEAQVMLRWGVQKGFPVLPKSTHPDRIRSNFDLFSFEIDAQDMNTIEAMDRGVGGWAWQGGDPVNIP